jgi:hypothetical protein
MSTLTNKWKLVFALAAKNPWKYCSMFSPHYPRKIKLSQIDLNMTVHQTCVFSQSERLLLSNQKCLSRLKRPANLSSVKSDCMLLLSGSQIVFNNCIILPKITRPNFLLSDKFPDFHLNIFALGSLHNFTRW